MYGGLSTKCMETGILSQTPRRQLAHVILTLWGGGGHKYRVLRTGGDVERAAAPRNRRYRPCASSPTRRLEKFEILRVTRA